MILDAGGTVIVYWNTQPPAGAAGPRRWAEQAYRRQKQNWNYYSP